METAMTTYTHVLRKYSTANICPVPLAHSNLALLSVPHVLSGQVPGMLVNDMNGIPGSASKIRSGGQSSIGPYPGWANLPANSPLIIVNDIPLSTGDDPLSLLPSAAGNPLGIGAGAGGMSALDFINSQDIENMAVLKGADATAIYGSRGSNDVIVITTRRGNTGPPKISMDISSSCGTSINTMPVLNTRQYIAMRKEALANDGHRPDAQNAPDLVLWDTTRYSNFKKMLVGNTARADNAHLSLSGGKNNTMYYISGGLRRQTTVFPGDSYYMQRFFNGSLSVSPKGRRYTIGGSVTYSSNTAKLPVNDLTPGTRLAPNAFPLVDTSGHLAWTDNNAISITNPLSWLSNSYTASINTFIGSLHITDTVLKNLFAKLYFGANNIENTETSLLPIAAQDTAISDLGSANFASNLYKSWSAECQLEYRLKIKELKITLMAGNSFQSVRNSRNTLTATGYSSDDLLGSRDAAKNLSASGNTSLYNYAGLFASVNAAIAQKIFVNLSGRRDGSSRFGPGNRFGNFGSAGAAWVICDDTSNSGNPQLLSFLKLRGGYGITGNDQIGNYNYLDAYTILPASRAYGGLAGLSRDRLANPYYSWEISHKLDLSLYLEFIKRIKLEATWYRNRSTRLLVSDVIADQAGFGVQDNINAPAIVQNSAFEFILSSYQLAYKRFTFEWRLTLTIPYNKLIYYPNLPASSYSKSLVTGQSLTVQRGYLARGVDPATGIMLMRDLNNDGQITPADYSVFGNADPKYYGSFSCSVNWKGLQLDAFLEGRKQPGLSALLNAYNNTAPGQIDTHMFSNQMTDVLNNRWQKPGDIAAVQKLSAASTSPASNALYAIKSSNLQFTDASFIRFKTISLSYIIPRPWWMKQRKDENKWGEYKLYVEGQNLFTVTRYKGTDPVTQNFNAVPPIKMITCGLHVTF